MSLIPSESYSFPDHFTTTKAASRNPKKVEPEVEAVEPPRKKPTIVALPNPKPRVQPPPQAQRAPTPEPESPVERTSPAPARNKPAVPPPNPAMRRASAPPPRIPEAPPVRKISLPPGLKPKVRWNQRVPAMDPAAAPIPQNGAEQFQPPPMPAGPAKNVIQMRPAKAAPPPRVIARPAPDVIQNQMPAAPAKPAAPVASAKLAAPVAPAKPATQIAPAMQPQPTRPAPRPVAIPNPQEDFFQMFAESGETAVVRRRRKTKFRRFLVCESAALAVLLPLAIIGLANRPSSAALLWIMNISTIASAVAAAVIPIVFYAFTPTLPEIER